MTFLLVNKVLKNQDGQIEQPLLDAVRNGLIQTQLKIYILNGWTDYY